MIVRAGGIIGRIADAPGGCPRMPARPLLSRLLGSVLLLTFLVGVAGPACAEDGSDVQSLLSAGRAAEALRLIDRQGAGQAGDARLLYQRGVALSALGRTDEAISVFRQITVSNPELPGPYNNLAVAYAAQGDLEQARQALEQAVRLAPGYVTAWRNLGDVHARLAEAAYERARVAASAPADPGRGATGTGAGNDAAIASPPNDVDVAAVTASLRAWALAWSTKDLQTYFAAYAPAYKGNAASRSAWERERRDRILGKGQISVTLADTVTELHGASATVRFTQHYRTDTLDEFGAKRVELERGSDGRWRITREEAAPAGGASAGRPPARAASTAAAR